jgi:hypothetical protein
MKIIYKITYPNGKIYVGKGGPRSAGTPPSGLRSVPRRGSSSGGTTSRASRNGSCRSSATCTSTRFARGTSWI